MIKRIFYDITSVEKNKLYFIVINIFIALLRFVRSFVFMKYLDFSELGLISIVLTIISFFGMFQIGFLNGGYRILSVEKDDLKKQEVNNITYTFFLILFILLSIISLLVWVFNTSLEVNFFLILLSVFFGLVTLVNNWIRNILSAYMSFKELNILEFLSTSISLLGLLTVPFIGLKGALVCLLSQPFIFLVVAFIKYKQIRPTRLYFNFKQVKWILTFGFIPFLTGIFLQVNNQIEKWSILYYLDTAALGKFYLPALYYSLFMLVPFSVGKLFFPPVMQKFVDNNFKALKKDLINYYIFLISFSIIAIILTYFLLEPIVIAIFPKHLIGIKFVWAIFPGLIALLLLEPLSLLFYASVKLRGMFWVYLTSSFVMFTLIILSNKILSFSLLTMSYIKSIISIYITLFLYILFFIKKDEYLSINKKVVRNNDK